MKFVLFLLLCSLLALPIMHAQSSTMLNVFEKAQMVEIDATLNKRDCNNKFYIPIRLPEGASSFVYNISAPNKKKEDIISDNLLETMQSLSEDQHPDKIADFIHSNDKYRDFNFYILSGKEHAESFNNCGYYEYIEKYIGTKPRSGYIEKNSDQTYYLAFENNRGY